MVYFPASQVLQRVSSRSTITSMIKLAGFALITFRLSFKKLQGYSLMMAMRGELLIITGIAMIFIGFLLVFIGTLIASTGGEAEVEGGGVIMIGPIPIIFGTQRGATLAMILAIILMLLWIFMVLLSRRV